jgi:hypothetical protein
VPVVPDASVVPVVPPVLAVVLLSFVLCEVIAVSFAAVVSDVPAGTQETSEKIASNIATRAIKRFFIVFLLLGYKLRYPNYIT